MNKLIIKNSKTVRRIKDGHQWIFANELTDLPVIPAGSVIDIFSNNNEYFGKAFFNRNSLIAARLLNSDFVSGKLLAERIERAFRIRKSILPLENSYRLVFGESDFLTGLIIDKYEDYFSIQILTSGWENFKKEIIQTLIELFPKTQGIIFKNENYWRKIEGLNEEDVVEFGTIPEFIRISENNILYDISLTEGQKTGYFFDQRLNRKFLNSISQGKTVLDLFTNQGGFALNSAYGNAENALGIDISDKAISFATKNISLNKFSNIKFESADVFEYLKKLVSENTKFDIVVCDPPAFAKNKKSIKEAEIAYKRVNKLALRCLKEDGILLTSSCSQHIEEEAFSKILQKSALESGKLLIEIFKGNQSPDHPILTVMKETKYLKFFGYLVK